MGLKELAQIDTIVILMMENRSFDQMLGYLSLPPYNRQLDGIRNDPAWIARYTNHYNGRSYRPFPLTAIKGTKDALHDRADVSQQIGTPTRHGFPMTGFAQSYGKKYGERATMSVMGYYTAPQVPMTHFLAQSYAVCDKWFSSLPTGTQPNKLMALTGSSTLDCIRYRPGIQYTDPLVYEWLTGHNVDWRLYVSFLPFASMLAGWPHRFLTTHNYRHVSQLVRHVRDPRPFPQVIFIEPVYTIQKVIKGNDYHAPAPIRAGERLLSKVYNALTANVERWQKTLLIVTFDEHGGFFDHVSPLPIVTSAPAGWSYPAFHSTGLRVPALVISPLVQAQTVFSGALDHTSLLRLLAERFGSGHYSRAVDHRQAQGLHSIAEVLNLSRPRVDIPTAPTLRTSRLQRIRRVRNVTEEAQAFDTGARRLRQYRPGLAKATLR